VIEKKQNKIKCEVSKLNPEFIFCELTSKLFNIDCHPLLSEKFVVMRKVGNSSMDSELRAANIS